MEAFLQIFAHTFIYNININEQNRQQQNLRYFEYSTQIDNENIILKQIRNMNEFQ